MFISQEDLNLFHSIDRKLYAILVINLWHDPMESMQIMALWMWLERVGFNNVVQRILALPIILINELAGEAITCLSCIHSNQPLFSSEANEISLTCTFMKKDISLQFFQENRDLVIRGLEKVTNEVCFKVFTNLLEESIGRNNAQKLAESQILYEQSLAHGFGHNNNIGEGELVPAEERTMFVTFSKGYPVAEWELRDFFGQFFGDCIESFYMQDVKGTDEQALFARIVFFEAQIIHMILNGVDKAKFTINGKHVWMRKFVPKQPRIQSSPWLPQSPFRSS